MFLLACLSEVGHALGYPYPMSGKMTQLLCFFLGLKKKSVGVGAGAASRPAFNCKTPPFTGWRYSLVWILGLNEDTAWIIIVAPFAVTNHHDRAVGMITPVKISSSLSRWFGKKTIVFFFLFRQHAWCPVHCVVEISITTCSRIWQRWSMGQFTNNTRIGEIFIWKLNRAIVHSCFRVQFILPILKFSVSENINRNTPKYYEQNTKPSLRTRWATFRRLTLFWLHQASFW